MEINCSEKRDGFTLMELIMVTAIIGLLSAVSFAVFQIGGRQLALDRAAQKVAQDIRSAMGLALSAEPFICDGGVHTGYGIYFAWNIPDSYIIYAECNGNTQYNVGNDGIVATISLERDIELKSLGPDPSLSITFFPPDPSVSFSGGDAAGIITIAPKDAEITEYKYWHTGDVPGHSQSPLANFRPGCWDNDRRAKDCVTFPFLGSQADPAVVFDRFCNGACSPPNRWSQKITKLPSSFSSTKNISVSAKGVIEVQ